MKKIIWTLNAKNSYKNNVNYLKLNWTQTEINRFNNTVFKKLELLRLNPFLGTFDSILECNKLLILTQISLLYRIENEIIYLLYFWDNRQKPMDKLL